MFSMMASIFNKAKMFTLALLLSAGTLFATDNQTVQHDQNHEGTHADVQHHEEEAKVFNMKEMISHHIGDAHEFHVVGDVTVPLPVILYTDNGLVTFLSSEFHHDDKGQVVVSKKGMNFVKNHEKIYMLKEGETSLHLDHETHEALNAEKTLDFSITKNVFSMWLSIFILLVVFLSVAKAYKKNTRAPKGLQSFMEPIIVFVRDEIVRPNITATKVDKYMPFLLTVFFFIWVNNLLGLIPIFPGTANLTGNIAVTLVLALVTFFITTFSANKSYWGHIFNTPGVPKWLLPIMVPVEVLGMFTKPFALMIRLLANITAGHIIILTLVSIILSKMNTPGVSWLNGGAGLAVPFMIFMNFLELLVAALQAYVFTMLSALFIGQAVDDHH